MHLSGNADRIHGSSLSTNQALSMTFKLVLNGNRIPDRNPKSIAGLAGSKVSLGGNMGVREITDH
jgi:hypothetical protein